MARAKRTFAYQKELARRHGFDSYYQWRKAGYPAQKSKHHWLHRTFTSAEHLIRTIDRMPDERIIRVDVWYKPYPTQPIGWYNIYAKGTVEEFMRRLNQNILTLPTGVTNKQFSGIPQPYSLRWRTQ